VNLLVGLLTGNNIRAARDKENHYDEEHWNGVTRNYYLAYHQLKAHLHWLATRPDEAAHYGRFQVSVFSICVATSKRNCNYPSHLYSCITASKRQNVRRLGIHVVSRLVMYRTKVLMYHTMVLLACLTKVRC
jgi:hypothetical protein